ncbi:ABC transporter permease [Nibrella viscosa]|uniref:ABC transporter permease n=1 Tax=Nibrella viscosa TaxID=1084524 RepID=A0ABP8KNE7_9BACT
MLKNYLKIAWRNLLRHPTTTSIHLLGLTLGLTTCLLILLFIQNEWSYDRHHQLGNRIYRVNQIQTTGEEVERSGTTPYPLAPAMRLDFSDWQTITRIHADRDVSVVISREKILLEDKVLFAEPELLDMFDFEMVTGNGRATLGQPNQVILTESTARKYFGTTPAVGKTFRLDNRVTVQVTGIMRDMPSQSNLNARMLVSFATMKDYFQLGIDQWGVRSGGSVFVLLPEGKTPEHYTARLAANSRKYFADRKGEKNELVLQPLHDIHFNPDYQGSEFSPPIAPTYMYVFGIVGLFVLLIACVNFINMSTARAMTRAREVGVRKVVGATQSQLVRQFLSEAFWLAAFSALLALVLSYSLLPQVNDFLQKQIAFRWAEVIGLLVILALLTTVSAGGYPAFFLSRFKPVRVLKSLAEPGRSGQGWLRQGLVVFQFTISLVLAVGVLIVYRQMNYFRQKDLGFNRDALVTVGIPQTKNLAPIAQELRQIPGVDHVSFALGAPTSGNNFGTDMRPDPANQEKKISIALKIADADYLETYGLKLLAGRFLDHRDTLAIAQRVPEEQRRYVFVVNENAVKALGYSRPEQALGRKISVGLNNIEAEIVGVVKDFHTSSLRDPIQPMVMLNFPYFYRSIGIKLHTSNYTAAMAAIERVWRKFYPDDYFDAEFLDQSLQEQYEEEMRQFTLLRIFAGLALIICCLGLWGLATFVIERRTKEIGVRKVLGASVPSLVSLLSRDFLKLVFIAILIATPIAWYAMDQWLQNFNYRIGLEWWVFGLVGVMAIAIAFLTVSFQSIKAALINPVRSLRSE